MKHFYSFIISFFLLSCAGKNNVPSEIIQQKEMQNILWDIIKAQTLSVEVSRKDTSVNEVTETKTLTQKVYEIHHITSSAFDKSYSWYLNHPEVFRIILDSMYNYNQAQNALKAKDGHKSFNKNSAKKIKVDEQNLR